MTEPDNTYDVNLSDRHDDVSVFHSAGGRDPYDTTRRPSLAHLLNQAPEFHTGLVELDAQAFDHPPLLADAIPQHALPPERADQGAVLDEIAALDALSEAWERTFGGVWLPPSK